MPISLYFNLLPLLALAVYSILSPLLVVSSSTSFFNFLPYVDSASCSSHLVLRLFCFFLCCFFFYTFDSSCTSSVIGSASFPSILLFFRLLFIGNQLEDSPNYQTPRKFFLRSLLYSHVKIISKFCLWDCKAIFHMIVVLQRLCSTLFNGG